MRRASWRPFQNLRSRTALRCGRTAGSMWFNQMGTTSKDATVRMTKNSTNAKIWTQVGYFSDTPRMNASIGFPQIQSQMSLYKELLSPIQPFFKKLKLLQNPNPWINFYENNIKGWVASVLYTKLQFDRQSNSWDIEAWIFRSSENTHTRPHARAHWSGHFF